MMATPFEHALNPWHRYGPTVCEQQDEDNASFLDGYPFNISDVPQQGSLSFSC